MDCDPSSALKILKEDLSVQLHPEVTQLADLLLRIEEHLAKHEVAWWATKIGRCRASLEISDTKGLHDFIALFGGMGSLNDVVLQRDGKMLTTENDELRKMLGKAWTLGEKLLQEEVALARGD